MTNKMDKRNRKMDAKRKDLIDSLELTQETRKEIRLQNQNQIKNGDERNARE